MFGLFRGLRKLTWFLISLVIVMNYSSCTPKDYIIPSPWLKENNAPNWLVETSYAINIPHMIMWNISDICNRLYNGVSNAQKRGAQIRAQKEWQPGEQGE